MRRIIVALFLLLSLSSVAWAGAPGPPCITMFYTVSSTGNRPGDQCWVTAHFTLQQNVQGGTDCNGNQQIFGADRSVHLDVIENGNSVVWQDYGPGGLNQVTIVFNSQNGGSAHFDVKGQVNQTEVGACTCDVDYWGTYDMYIPSTGPAPVQQQGVLVVWPLTGFLDCGGVSHAEPGNAFSQDQCGDQGSGSDVGSDYQIIGSTSGSGSGGTAPYGWQIPTQATDPGSDQGCTAGSGFPHMELEANPFTWPLRMLGYLCKCAIWLIVPQQCVLDQAKNDLTSLTGQFPLSFAVFDNWSGDNRQTFCMGIGGGQRNTDDMTIFRLITPDDVLTNCYFNTQTHTMVSRPGADGMTALERHRIAMFSRAKARPWDTTPASPLFALAWPTSIDTTPYIAAIHAFRNLMLVFLWGGFFVRALGWAKAFVGLVDNHTHSQGLPGSGKGAGK